MMDDQPAHLLLDLSPSPPPPKKPKLEPKPEVYDDLRLQLLPCRQYQNGPPLDIQVAAPIADDEELPEDFLEPLPIEGNPLPCRPPLAALLPPPPPSQLRSTVSAQRTHRGCRQFWKAGDYEGDSLTSAAISVGGGIDHVRVHPKFLHSNATSHKWALGAVAELLDNAVDEVNNGATFVNVDMVQNPRDGGPMLLIEDDGGGMSPDCMRQCMSLGYSVKSKSANTIGQYGNGFKTSTMRLGSDVVVFSRFPGGKGGSPTQSIGMLSYSFLRDTRQEDIIVPMIDYEIEHFGLRKLVRSTVDDWKCNMDTITKWSPYSTEADLLDQFHGMKQQGTKIILYNLWEDDQGQLELDFESDPYDIQVRGANRDEKKISMAARFPNSRHYLTYRHSLRSYASILYLRLPGGFSIILRGKEVEHHTLVNDLMFTQELTYRPHGGGDNVQRETNMIAVVTVGFVKDAKDHVDVQGFNVYHKNRLIKPFWRIWNSSSSQGRGIIGVLEANFVEPAHDKQGFERTTVLARLEARLLQMQKTYWTNNCHKVGYHSARKRDTPRMYYPARGLQPEAPYEGRVHTRRGGTSEQDCSQSSKPSTPKTFPITQVTQGDDISPALCLFEKKDVATNGTVEKVEDSSLLDRCEVDVEGFLKEVEKNKQLEAKVMNLEKKMDEIKSSIEKVVKERDVLRMQLEGELRQRAIEDEELRIKLKDAYLRIKQLEAENNCLSVSHC